MSAYLVCHHHIDALATFAWKRNTYINHYNTHWCGANHAQEIAAALWRANVDSVTDRYGDADGQDNAYTFKQYPNIEAVPLLQIVKAAQCFDYQACEVPSYEQSLAAAITSAIIGDACRLMDGWKGLDWGMPEPKTPPAPRIKLTPQPLPLGQVPLSSLTQPQTLEQKAAALTAELFAQLASNNPQPTTTPTPATPVKRPATPTPRPTPTKTPTKRPPTQDEPF